MAGLFSKYCPVLQGMRILLPALLLFLPASPAFSQPFRVKIAISKASPNYVNWLLQADSAVILPNLYEMSVDSAVATLKTCDGLLLTGGEDVYPGWYGREHDTARCTEMNRRRDTLDMALIIVRCR
jgi:gamma-glutamyl-gamma-aminobutyrate hydrolase PuuD